MIQFFHLLNHGCVYLKTHNHIACVFMSKSLIFSDCDQLSTINHPINALHV